MKQLFAFIFLICALLTGLNLKAQNLKVDSLLQSLKASKEDTGRVNTWNRLSMFAGLRAGNYDTAFYFARQAQTLAQKIDYKKGLAGAYSNYGLIWHYKGNYPEALKNHTEALKLREEIGDKAGIANTRYFMGIAYNNQANYPEAVKCYQVCIKVQEELKDKKGAANCYNNMGTLFDNQGNYPEALKNHLKCLKLRQETGDKFGMATSYHNIGIIHYNQGNYPEALKNYFAALKLREEIGDKKGIASTSANIGVIYHDQHNYAEALKNYRSALKIQEEINDKKGIATTSNYMGNVYRSQGNYAEALKNYNTSLKLFKEKNDKKGLAESYSNIGSINRRESNYTEATQNYQASLKLSEELNDKCGISASYCNIGSVYTEQHKAKEGAEWQQKALALSREIGEKSIIKESYLGLANADSAAGNFQGALANYKLYIVYRDSIDNEETQKKSLQSSMQYEFDKKEAVTKANFEKTQDSSRLEQRRQIELQALRFEYQKKQALVKTDEERRQLIFEQELKRQQIESNYKQQQAALTAEQERKIALAKAEQEKKDAIATEEKKRQRVFLALISCVLLLVVVFAVVIFNRFRITRKQKTVIEQKELETREQKHIIEEKHKEITDSINYAERIQRSFLASTSLLDEQLLVAGSKTGADYFVYFQPKDVVSGDFYWASILNNGNFAYATADSTGHGVPGAIMSILNISSLEKAIERQTEPALILNETRKHIIERLKKDGSAEGGKDGMDCSLVVMDKNKQQLHYAAANNPVWIVRKAGTEGEKPQLIELAPDKMPVGKHDKDQQSFTQHTVDLQQGDVVYTLTDGLPDQFGGPKGKKFMYKQLKELIVAISQLPMNEQKQKLSETLNSWKGELEQVDDVTLMGIRI